MLPIHLDAAFNHLCACSSEGFTWTCLQTPLFCSTFKLSNLEKPTHTPISLLKNIKLRTEIKSFYNNSSFQQVMSVSETCVWRLLAEGYHQGHWIRSGQKTEKSCLWMEEA